MSGSRLNGGRQASAGRRDPPAAPRASPSPLDALSGQRVLLLQGPAGPCFRRLARFLEQRGARLTKVNFNAADDLFFSGPGVIRFRDPFDAWPAFFDRVVREHAIDAIVVFGDTRPLHELAILRSRALGLRAFVLEEGYLRPDFVTVEEGGVGGRSGIPKDPDFYRSLVPTELPPPRPVGNTLAPAALYATLYACAHALGRARYPHYRHHRDIRPLRQAARWVRGGARRVWHGVRDRELDRRLASADFPPFFLVPLQVHLDAAVRDSDFPDVRDFIVTVVESFARHAPQDCVLVVKDHPLDRPYRDYRALLTELSAAHRLGDRLRHVDVIHLPTALARARGTVVINSTVGLSSLFHQTPVKCLGRAVYDMSGLTHQGPLDQFWTSPGAVDGELYLRFRYWLLTNNQINGSVWTELWP